MSKFGVNEVGMSATGWIRQSRINKGLKGYQLAQLLEVSAARVSVLEKDEARGAVTLKMMAKVAKAMGCRFEYQIIPVRGEKNRIDDTREAIVAKPRYRVVDARLIENSLVDSNK